MSKKKFSSFKKYKNYNCMGYAFGIYKWLYPYDDCDKREYEINQMFIEECDEEDMEEALLIQDVSYILSHFKKVRLLKSENEAKNNERIIAYRNYVEEDMSGELTGSYDYHFRFKKPNDVWREKCGKLPPEICADDDWGPYKSRIVLFAIPDKKII